MDAHTQKPLHHWFFFWFGPAVFLILGLLAADSFFHQTRLIIPREGPKVPADLYLSNGLLQLDLEETPDPHMEKNFAFQRSNNTDRQLHILSDLYQHVDAYKYQGATAAERKAAKAAGIKSPLVTNEFKLPIVPLMGLVAIVWWIVVRRRSKRLAKEAMELAAKSGA